MTHWVTGAPALDLDDVGQVRLGVRQLLAVERACGRTVLITCELAQAEFARDQIQAYGPDWRLVRSKGSMTALIEPVS